MERRTLRPSEIVVPDEIDLGNEEILAIYFRVFNSGYPQAVPPVITTTIGDPNEIIDWLEDGKKGIPRWEDRFAREVSFDREQEEKLAVIRMLRSDYVVLLGMFRKSPYMLQDGNHRAVAATLTHSSIPALELQTEGDIQEVREMIGRGELPKFNRGETTIRDLRRAFVANCLDLNFGGQEISKYDGSLIFTDQRGTRLKDVCPLDERVERLVSKGELPQYMIERYRRR